MAQSEYIQLHLPHYTSLLTAHSSLLTADLKQVAQAVAGIDLNDHLVAVVFTLFDENCESLHPPLPVCPSSCFCHIIVVILLLFTVCYCLLSVIIVYCLLIVCYFTIDYCLLLYMNCLLLFTYCLLLVTIVTIVYCLLITFSGREPQLQGIHQSDEEPHIQRVGEG